MKKEPVAVLLACIGILICSCNKFSIGDITVVDRTIPTPFQAVEFRDDVNVKLLHCDASHSAGTIQIKAGENLIDNISAVTQNRSEFHITPNGRDTVWLNKLVICNNNTFGFLHSYDYSIEMTVYYDTICSLIFNSNATVLTDTLRGYNLMKRFKKVREIEQDTIEYDSLVPCLNLKTEGGSGDFTVMLNCCKLETKYSKGTSTITLKGSAVSSIVTGRTECHGIIDAKDMEANWSELEYKGTNTVYVKAFDELHINNDNIGRVFYVKYKKRMNTWIDDGTPYGTIIDSVHSCPHKVEKEGENIFPFPI